MRARGLVTAGTIAAALFCAEDACAQQPATVATVSTSQGAVSITESQLAHQLHVARRTTPGSPTLQDLETDAMDTLLNGVYLRGEAQEEHITITDREVEKALNQQRPKSFKTLKDYRRYLAQTGQTRQDLLEQIRQQLIADALKQKAAAPMLGAVTPLYVTNYVKTHPRYLPERRDVLIIFTAQRNDADAARRAIERGTPFADAAREYSLDEVTKAAGGFDPMVTRTSVEPKLAKQIFRSHADRLEGPVHTKFGYYVFAVVKTYARRPVTQQRQIETAKAKLEQQAATAALTAYSHDFNAKWIGRTTCAPKFTFNAACSNHH